MPDPEASIAAEAEAGVAITPDGEVAPDGMEAPGWQERAIELFKPCPEDATTKKGLVSQAVNGFLAKRSGVPVEEIDVGENLAHCIDHVFPGGLGSAGMPPIVGLGISVMKYRAAANKHPDNGKLVRP